MTMPRYMVPNAIYESFDLNNNIGNNNKVDAIVLLKSV